MGPFSPGPPGVYLGSVVKKKKNATFLHNIYPGSFDPCKKKEMITGGGKIRRKSALQNIILTLLNMPWRRKKRFLVDGTVRWWLPTPIVILAVLR